MEPATTQAERAGAAYPIEKVRAAFPALAREVHGRPVAYLDSGASAQRVLATRPKLVAVAHVSNVLGIENPLAEIAHMAHEAGALVVVDGAQAAPKLGLDVAELGVDFYALTGHKAYAPTGIGALWARLD